MNFKNTNLKDVIVLEPVVYGDNRGWFTETWTKKTMDSIGIQVEFVQDNHAYSSQKGTLRGLHFQAGESSQSKLVRCIKGAVLDVAVDLRTNSPTFCQWFSVELTEENKKQLYIPKGFAHGYLTLTDDVEFLYKTDNYYNPSSERGILWNDSQLNIDWGISTPIVSDKDKINPIMAECLDFF